MATRSRPSQQPLYLKQWREYRNLTQSQLAEAMKTTFGTVSKKESAPERVDVSWMQRFAAALAVAPTDLFHHPADVDLSARIAALGPEDRDRVARFVDALTTAASAPGSKAK